MRATRRPSHAHRLLLIVLAASIGLTGSVSAAPGDAVKGPFTVGGLSGSDGVEVSGAFVTGRSSSREAGLLVSIMVADAEATLQKVAAHGGEIVEPVHPGAPEIVARFRDPAGNLLGIYQERALAPHPSAGRP